MIEKINDLQNNALQFNGNIDIYLGNHYMEELKYKCNFEIVKYTKKNVTIVYD